MLERGGRFRFEAKVQNLKKMDKISDFEQMNATSLEK
jgi:hypothetical protein